MSENNKSYRIRTFVGADSDQVLNLNINQDINLLEILSLNVGLENAYKLQAANYGCLAGRVLANGNFGIPNAKISIFVSATQEDLENPVLAQIYPYKNTFSKDENGIRYNLLPEEKVNDCHQAVGTFPSKRLVLDDNNVLEIFDKYYKYTTVTNQSGDYLIFGIPTGNNIVHVDIDLSDIGILSQKPIDLQYKGYNSEMFENSQMFKTGTNIDNLAQIISQNDSVYVYPFWGENNEIGAGTTNNVKITRHDIEIQYKFEPTCIFLGSIITDDSTQGISKECVPSQEMGKMETLKTGEGTIEMIRKTQDGSVEQVVIQGDQLINGDGIWCYQIPMNLDYVMTDEYGNTVPTDNPNKGIPTRTNVRFRLSLNAFENDYVNNHLCKVLIPNNPKTIEESIDYQFGDETKDESFRNLFWNKVYTVKSYIPRIQNLNVNWLTKFTGIKDVSNVPGDRNPMPYNNIRVNLSFRFRLQCAIMKILIWTTGVVNSLLHTLGDLKIVKIVLGKENTERLLNNGKCLQIGDGVCPDLEGWYFAPNCRNAKYVDFLTNTLNSLNGVENKSPEDNINGDSNSIDYENRDENSKVCVTAKTDYLLKCVEINLALENRVIQFNFYNDWVNGTIYTPRWFAKIPKQSKFIDGTTKKTVKNYGCLDTRSISRRLIQACPIIYGKDEQDTFYTENVSPLGCSDISNGQRCDKVLTKKNIFTNGALIHRQASNLQNKYVYYVKPCEWTNDSVKKKINLFATDIVLLGSLNENDIDGIPQTFKRIPATSYLMPQNNLVSTNLDSATLFGASDNSSICNGYTASPVKEMPKTFRSYKVWDSKNAYDVSNEDISDDAQPITEESGIDWAETGPGQGKNNKDGLYYPGGHFLGVSCNNAEVNIKSCVNLYRACELGSSLSNREELVSTDGYNLTYSYLVPTGLISGNNIIDRTARFEFATLNHCGLETEINGSVYQKYKFYPLFPLNFNGELRSIVSTSPLYNVLSGSTNNEYRRVIEEPSKDYYMYRFGLQNDNGDTYVTREGKTIEFKYLHTSQNNKKATFPVYENSFYFYFGLRNGLTALDKFYKDYFASCTKNSAKEPEIIIKSITPSDFCKGNNNGAVKVEIRRFINPSITIRKTNSDIEVGPTEDNGSVYDFSGLEGDTEYIITVVASNAISEKTIFVGMNLPIEAKNFTVTSTDYSKEIYYNTTDSSTTIDTGSTGTITMYNCLNIPGICIYNDWEYYIVKGDESYFSGIIGSKTKVLLNIDITNDSGDSTQKIYAWRGACEYTIAIKPTESCNNIYTYPQKVWVGMEAEFTLSCYDGNYNLKPIYGKLRNGSTFESWIAGTWWADCISSSTISKEEKWAVNKAITDQNSLFNLSQVSVRISPMYGEPPYSYSYSGDSHAEVFNYTSGGTTQILVLDKNSLQGETYNDSHLNFNVPSSYLYASNYSNFYQNFTLYQMPSCTFNIIFKDSATNKLQIKVPSNYKPFFFNLTEMRRFNSSDSGFTKNFDLSVLNGITLENKFEYDINNVSGVTNGINDFIATQTATHTSGITGDYYIIESGFTIATISGETISRSNSSEITVSEIAPNGSIGMSLYEEIPQIVFVGDKENNPTDNVKYFLVPRGVLLDSERFVSALKDSSGNTNGFDYTTSGETGNYRQWLGSPLLSIFNYTEPEETEERKAFFINKLNEFSGYTDPGEYYNNEWFVIGVYDPWTTLTNTEFNDAFCRGNEDVVLSELNNKDYNSRIKWIDVYPHTNMVSVICRYEANIFIDLLKELYGN